MSADERIRGMTCLLTSVDSKKGFHLAWRSARWSSANRTPAMTRDMPLISVVHHRTCADCAVAAGYLVAAAGDFAVIVKTLQRYPSVDVDHILRAAARLPPCASVLGAPV